MNARLNPLFTAGWILLNVSLLITAMFPWATGGLAPWLLLAFALFEAAAILRAAPGDTLSEHVWLFYHRRPARQWLVLGYSVLLVSLVFYVSFGLVLVYRLGLVTFGIGFGVWLIQHFLSIGDAG